MDLLKRTELVAILLTSFLLVSCSQKSDVSPKEQEVKKNVVEAFKDELKEHSKINLLKSIPPIVLPSAYVEPNLLDDGSTISFSSNGVAISKLLLIISKESGLNLAIDKDVDVSKQVTVNMMNVSVKEALDIVMDVSDNYFELKGNILYVKKFRTQTFLVPFINMKLKSASSVLGGDILGNRGAARGSGSSGLSGSSKYEYSSDPKISDFYEQFISTLNKIKSKNGVYSLNKFSGILTVTDFNSKIKKMEKLIAHMNNFINKQVLVDTRIVEVILDDKHQLGINWQNISKIGEGVLTFSQAIPVTSTISTLAYSEENFDGVISAMKSSGDIEVVSNPRIKVLNGQVGMLASGNMEPFWEKEVTYTEVINTANEKEYIPSIIYNRVDVLNGISLGVTPIIKENGTVILNIIPIITNIEGEKVFSDDGKEVATAPIINVKEVGTTVVVKDNEMIVIGGLISSKDVKYEYKVPLLGDIPYLGKLFQGFNTQNEKRELVIILKINIQKTNL